MQKLKFINGNGTEIDLTAGRYGITEWSGFSNADLNIQSQQVPFHDGAVFLDALYNSRELSVTVAINDDNDLEKRYELKRELISAMNAKLGEGYLYYKNDFIEKRIKVVPQLPIFENKNSNDPGTLKASLTWIAPEFYWEDIEEKIISLKKNEIVDIKNEGDVKSQIIVNAVNQGQEKISIENIITRKKIEVDSNKDMTINTNFGQKSIKESKTQLIRNSFSIESSATDGNIYLYGGDWLYNSLDGINLNIIDSIQLDLTLVAKVNVFYSKLYQKFIVSCRHSIYLSEDGVNFTLDYHDIMSNTFDNLFYENNNCLITRTSGYNFIYYKKTDIDQWERVNFPNSTVSEKLIVKKGNVFVVVEFYNDVSYVYETEDFSTFTLKLSLNSQLKSIEYVENQNAIYFSDDSNIYKYNSNSYSLTTSWQISDISYLFFSKNRGLFACSNSSLFLFTSNWQTIDNNIRVKKIVDFKDDVFIASYSNGSYKLEMNELKHLFDSDKVFVNVNDLILWLSNSYTLDGNLWIPIDKSGSYIYQTAIFKQRVFGLYGTSSIKVSDNGVDFIRIKTENFTIQKIIATPDYLVRLSRNRYVGRSIDGINWEDFIITDSSNYSIYDIYFSEEFNCFIAVGYGGIWKSTNLENWTRVYSGNYNFYKIVFNEKRKIFFTTVYFSSSSKGYFFSYDSENWDYSYFGLNQNSRSIAVSDDGIVVFAQYNAIAYIKPDKDPVINNICFIDESIIVPAGEKSGTVFYSKILKKFFLMLPGIGKIYTSTDAETWEVFAYLPTIFNSESELYNIIYASVYIIRIIEEGNLISQLTANSDMDFNLSQGDNYILPNFNGDLIFRQKYLGV